MARENVQNFSSGRGRFFGSGVDEVLNLFPNRTQDILRSRYNLEGSFKRGRTLEAIGRQYGVTRERVRQIIQCAMKVARDKGAKSLDSAIERIDNHLTEQGGIFAKEMLFENLGAKTFDERGAVDFVLDYCDKFTLLSPGRYVTHAVAHKDFNHDVYQEIIQEAEMILSDMKRPTQLPSLQKKLTKKRGEEMNTKHLESYLISSATIDRNPLNEWGMMSWGDIRPKSSGQRAYLVLRHFKRPMHFTEIAQKINDLGLSSRRSNPQTVHNELIKSPLFALTGRGIYELSAWKK